jgi:tRNA threonylcarbamoyl adenosine modification protein YeaZ
MCGQDKPALVLNTAESRVQLVVGTRKKLLFAQQTDVQARTMQILPPAIDLCLKKLGLRPHDLERIAVVRGPGTFTGVRVGLSIALGLARGADLPMAGLDYLSLLAQGPARLMQEKMWVCSYARQNLVNIQAFSAARKNAFGPAQSMSKEGAVQAMTADGTGACVFGSGIRWNQSWWSKHLAGMHVLDPIWDNPLPEILLQAAWQEQASKAYVLPAYLRPSDAETHLEHIARERGVDPGVVRETIPDFECRS